MTYDTFLFFDELELLELRLEELSSVVDRFVLVESTRTFSNQPKPLIYKENRDRFARFAPKIVHVVVEDTERAVRDWAPEGKLRFAIEDHDRRAISRGLQGCCPSDLILTGDVDEIPRAEVVRACSQRVFRDTPAARMWSAWLRQPWVVRHFRNLFKKHHPLVTVFEQRMYYYFLNCACVNKPWWSGTRMVSYRDFTSAYDLRRWNGRRLPNAGWHFSYMGGAERIRRKIAAYAHQEFNRPEFTDPERIVQSISNLKYVLGGETELAWNEVDASFPQFIRENRKRFAAWLGPP